jgi:steroid 5-alpha reductase family enzyme
MNPFSTVPFWQEFLNLTTQSLLVMCIWMFILWLIHLAIRNAAIVDAGWAFGISFCAAFYAFQGSGAFPRRWLLAIMVLVWGLRLGLHLLFNRIIGHPEEGRYVELRRKWAPNVSLKFLLFYQVQAVSCVVLAIPFLLACMNFEHEFNIFDKAAIGLWVFATAGVTISDMQLNRFKANPENKGKVCREGLWSWSRHPNYFFEWLVWLSYGLYALTGPWGFLGMIAPALILHFVLNVTGVPPTEEQALRSKGEAYRKYQQEVSIFVPMPPKVQVES